MIPLRTLELRAEHRVEMLMGPATVVAVTADIGGGYAVTLRYDDGITYTARNAEASAVWLVDLN